MIELSFYDQMMRRYNRLIDERDPYVPDWKDIAKYLYPRREFLDKPKKGKRIATNIYDTKPIDFFNKLVNGYQGYMVSKSIDWFDMIFTIPELDNNSEAREWLDQVKEHLYYRYNDSNFYDGMHHEIKDGMSFATATLYMEDFPEEQTINYLPQHPISIVVSEDRHGRIDMTIRELELPAYEAVGFFGKNNVREKILKNVENKSTMDEKHTFLHYVFKRNDDFYKANIPQMFPWVSLYIEKDSPKSKDKPLKEGGYYENPYMTWRFDKVAPWAYGRGLAHDALPDIIMLNDYAKAVGIMIHKASDLPVYASVEHLGRLRLGPGGKNYYENYQHERIDVINNIGDYAAVKDYIEDKRENIKDLLMVDFFLLLATAERTKTAFEVNELRGEKAAVLGTSVGRFETEILDPIMNRTFLIEYENGRLPPMPDIVKAYGGAGIEIDYIGPLARIQKQLFRSNPITHSLSAVSNIMGIKPEAGDIVNWDEATRELLDAHNAPQKIILNEKEVAEIRRIRAEAQRRAMQAEQAQQGADTIQKLSKKVEKESPLDKLMAAGGAGRG